MSIVGERIKELRIENNFTQKKLAEIAEISEISIRKYESGDRIPKFEVIEKLSSIFNVQLDYLLGRSNQRKFDNTLLFDDFKSLSKIIDSSNNPEFSKLIRNIVDTMFLTIYKDSKEGNLDILLIIHDLYREIWKIKNLQSSILGSDLLDVKKENYEIYKKEINTLIDKLYKNIFIKNNQTY